MPNHNDIYIKIQKLISSARFNEAFMLLKNQMAQFPSLRPLQEQMANAEEGYKYMLDYLAEGHKDPSLNDMIVQTREVLFKANSLLLRELNLKDSSDVYSSTRRILAHRQISLDSLVENLTNILKVDEEKSLELDFPYISQEQGKAINEIFNYIWTIGSVNEKDNDILNGILDQEGLPDYIKAIIVSAITLENISYFDPVSFEILLNIYESTDSIIVKARALTGIVLISLFHSDRLAGNLQLRSRLMLSSEDENLKQLVNEVIIGVIKTYDTTRIDKKMRNEVIPGLMKIKPEIIDKMRNLASDSENFLSEGNPEWEELIQNSEIGDKLKEISDLQLEGADVMVTAFSSLKSFPFFSEAANWFLPFSPEHYAFSSLNGLKDKETLENLKAVMCDSDLHSFMLSLNSMPLENRERMLSQMNLQMKEAKEAMTNSIAESDSVLLRKKIKQTLQDLYRFFKFFSKNHNLNDPFAKPFLNTDIQPLIPVFGIEDNNILLIAEFYFKNKYYFEAAGLYELSDSLTPGNFSLWEKIGFCYDRLQQHEKAVDWYSKADIVNPGNIWLIKKLAVSLKNSGKFDEANLYYKKALENEPDNYHLLMSYGHSLLNVEKYDEALKQFYHAQYLKPEKKDPIRALAWTELNAGNFDKASALYSKLLEETDPDKTDYLNSAHSALASGNFKKAVRLYTKFIELSENKDITSLVLAFRDDSESLKKIGVKTSDLRLIVDKIRYNLLPS